MTIRLRAARLLRQAAARLDDRRQPPTPDPTLIDRHRRHGVGVVPTGYAQGRADLQLVHARRRVNAVNAAREIQWDGRGR